jgi:hypothetical protein
VTTNDVLYALSTLAQTCAALAAFVGAVGLFRLQTLREAQRTTERELRGLVGAAGLYGPDVHFRPIGEISEAVEKQRGSIPPTNPYGQATEAAGRALDFWRTFPLRFANSRRWLVIFEAWNLLLIGGSLVGFNYVPLLVASPCTFGALWAAAIGTVGVTGYCVYAWTRE